MRTTAAIAALMIAVTVACSKPAPPSRGDRIVTLTPSATELVAALGAEAALVGVDDYSTFPPSVATLPKVGSFIAPDFEAIIALRPSLVIADDIHDDAAAALDAAGVPVVRLPMHARPDVERALDELGRRLGRGAAATARKDEMTAARDGAVARRVGRVRRVLIVIDRAPGGLDGMIAAANGTWLDELVAMTGAANVLAGAATRYPKLSAEEIVRAAPDTILDVSYAADPVTAEREWRSRPELASVPAIVSGRIRVLKAPYFLAPSPRMALALAELERALE